MCCRQGLLDRACVTICPTTVCMRVHAVSVGWWTALSRSLGTWTGLSLHPLHTPLVTRFQHPLPCTVDRAGLWPDVPEPCVWPLCPPCGQFVRGGVWLAACCVQSVSQSLMWHSLSRDTHVLCALHS